MNEYEAKQAARKARYEERAERSQREANQTHAKAREMASAIPFGQPILVGHHSESRDRNYRKRIHRTFERSFEAQKKAEHYAEKAASVGTGGISSDDPDAIDKLRGELTAAEAKQELMRNANRAVRAAFKRGIREDGPAEDIAQLQGALKKATGRDWTETEARKVMERDFAGRRGFADYQLTNNSANIRRIKARIAELRRAAERETVEHTGEGWRIVENAEENRVQIFFDDIPSAEIRKDLKSRGFRWARSVGAWQRHLNNTGIRAAKCVVGATS